MQLGMKTRGDVDASAPLATASYTIDASNVTHITQILRNMYSDPIRAVIRELCANAVDAHLGAGVTKPFKVWAPTLLEPTFTVRDFGPGLDIEDTKRLLFGYGASGDLKRASNEQIGGFGIGGKCPFAITDQFHYNIYHGGRCRVWRCFLNELDEGKPELMVDEPSDEPSGIMVTIPVASSSVAAFNTALRHEFMWYTIKPEICAAGTEVYPWEEDCTVSPASAFSGRLSIKIDDAVYPITWEGCVDLESSGLTAGACYVVMGGIWYPLDVEQLKGRITAHSKFLGNLTDSASGGVELKDILGVLSVVLHLPIGVLQLAPTRESLQYSERTKRRAAAILDALLGDTAWDDVWLKSFKVDAQTASGYVATMAAASMSPSLQPGRKVTDSVTNMLKTAKLTLNAKRTEILGCDLCSIGTVVSAYSVSPTTAVHASMSLSPMCQVHFQQSSGVWRLSGIDTHGRTQFLPLMKRAQHERPAHINSRLDNTRLIDGKAIRVSSFGVTRFDPGSRGAYYGLEELKAKMRSFKQPADPKGHVGVLVDVEPDTSDTVNLPVFDLHAVEPVAYRAHAWMLQDMKARGVDVGTIHTVSVAVCMLGNGTGYAPTIEYANEFPWLRCVRAKDIWDTIIPAVYDQQDKAKAAAERTLKDTVSDIRKAGNRRSYAATRSRSSSSRTRTRGPSVASYGKKFVQLKPGKTNAKMNSQEWEPWKPGDSSTGGVCVRLDRFCVNYGDLYPTFDNAVTSHRRLAHVWHHIIVPALGGRLRSRFGQDGTRLLGMRIGSSYDDAEHGERFPLIKPWLHSIVPEVLTGVDKKQLAGRLWMCETFFDTKAHRNAYGDEVAFDDWVVGCGHILNTLHDLCIRGNVDSGSAWSRFVHTWAPLRRDIAGVDTPEKLRTVRMLERLVKAGHVVYNEVASLAGLPESGQLGKWTSKDWVSHVSTWGSTVYTAHPVGDTADDEKLTKAVQAHCARLCPKSKAEQLGLELPVVARKTTTFDIPLRALYGVGLPLEAQVEWLDLMERTPFIRTLLSSVAFAGGDLDHEIRYRAYNMKTDSQHAIRFTPDRYGPKGRFCWDPQSKAVSSVPLSLLVEEMNKVK